MRLERKVSLLNLLYTARYLLAVYFLFYIIILGQFEDGRLNSQVMRAMVRLMNERSLAESVSANPYPGDVAGPMRALFSASVDYIFCGTILIISLLLRLSHRKVTPVDSAGGAIILNKIRSIFIEKIPIYLVPRITSLNHKGIFISYCDANLVLSETGRRQLLFKLYHEFFHYKISDHYLGGLQHVLIMALASILVLILSDHVAFLFRPHLSGVFAMVLSIVPVVAISKYQVLSFSRAKECLADLFAATCVGNSNSDIFFDNQNRDFYIHPSTDQRKGCRAGDASILILALLSFNSLFLTVIAAYFSSDKILMLSYVAVVVESGIAALAFSLLRLSQFSNIALLKTFVALMLFGGALFVTVFMPGLFLKIACLILVLTPNISDTLVMNVSVHVVSSLGLLFIFCLLFFLFVWKLAARNKNAVRSH